MGIISRFFPYEYVEDVFSIDYRRLYEKGYRGVVLLLYKHFKKYQHRLDL